MISDQKEKVPIYTWSNISFLHNSRLEELLVTHKARPPLPIRRPWNGASEKQPLAAWVPRTKFQVLLYLCQVQDKILPTSEMNRVWGKTYQICHPKPFSLQIVKNINNSNVLLPHVYISLKLEGQCPETGEWKQSFFPLSKLSSENDVLYVYEPYVHWGFVFSSGFC